LGKIEMTHPDYDPTPVSFINNPVSKKKRWKLQRFLHEASVPFLATAGLISLLLGTIGFQKYFSQADQFHSLATSLYASLWLFTIEGGAIPSPIPWELEVARWLSPTIGMYAVILGLASLFRNQISLLILGLVRNHVIICGLGQKGLNITRNFRKLGYKVVVIDNDGNNTNIAICRELGAIVLIGDCRDEYLLYKAGILKAGYLIAVCGDDGVNSDTAVIARKISARRPRSKLNCSIHIKDQNLWVLLRTQEFSANQIDTFRLDIFNIYDQGAKQLFQEYPLTTDLSEHATPPHLLIVGFGGFAEQLILNAARAWTPQYDKNLLKLHISVIDPQAEMYVKKLCQEYSLVDQVCDWELYPFDTNSTEFLKADYLLNKDKQLEISTVFVTVEDENVGLSSALILVNRIRSSNVRILVRMTEEKGLASLIREPGTNVGKFKNLHMFGLMERTCKLNLIYNSSHESIARAIHAEYNRREGVKGNQPGSTPALVPWDQLTEELKEMNRTQADNIGTKLKAINCDILPWCDFGANKFSFTPIEIETLAKMEHERWCGQKIKQGWKYGSKRDNKLKLHPSLVPWDAPGLTNEEKDKDRETVAQMPYFLALAGYQIFRL
jgi:hypothetical protein